MNGAPLRVLHLNTERGWRGGERQTLWLARELGRQGHESAVAAWPGSPLFERAAGAGLTVWPVRPRFPIDPASALGLAGLVRGRYQVLHAHTGNAWTQAALAPRAGAGLVASKRVDRRSHAGALTRWKYRRSDALIAVSARVRELLLADGAPAERIAVVPDGVDLSRLLAPAPAEILAALGVRPGPPLVVMVAALVPVKDPITFVRAVAEAAAGTELQALLVGDGPLRAAVEAERRRLGLENRLNLAGWRDDADSLIAAADVLALTSRGEGQGSVLLDAMQCGLPVVASRAGGIPDAVLEGETGLLFEPGDAAAAGAALAALCRDEPLRRRLGAAGRERVRQFSLERTARLTVDVYRAALERRGR